MLVSLKWLAEVCDLSELEASAVAGALTARGLTVDALLEGPDGPVLDVDVPANRPDCLGHLGIARELSAAFGRRLLPRPAGPPASGPPVTSLLRVAIEAPDLCPRYTARVVRGVRVSPSPAWVAARLEACGLRAINNVVDASNLVLLELGHPIHTFDLARLRGAEIRVRRATDGESLTTLDGIDRALGPDMLVIADAERPIALAGVMGGANSEIGSTTTDVLIEAAYFHPPSIRKTAKRLGLSSDASQRFERGADPNGVLAAQEAAARLLAEIAGGTAVPEVIDVRPIPFQPREVRLRPERARQLLGFDPGAEEIRASLEALGLSPRDAEGGAVIVRPPSWRVDIEREADLVEEVARHLGYDRIPESSAGSPPSERDVRQTALERARARLAHLGFHEAFNYAMLAEGEDSPFVPAGTLAPLAITNPIAETLARLRRSLLPGLLRSADRNLRRGIADVRLFETGSVFLPRAGGGFPEERARAALAWAGASAPRHWGSRPMEADFSGCGGVVEALVRSLAPDLAFHRVPGGLPGLHPGRAAIWTSPEGDEFAWCGELHPDLAHSLDLPARLYLAEVDLTRLCGSGARAIRSAPLPRVPTVTRDLSLVLNPSTTWSGLVSALSAIPAPAPVRFEAIDRYQGEPLAPGEVSVTVRVILQPLEITLTDAETEAYRASLVRTAGADLGARLRS